MDSTVLSESKLNVYGALTAKIMHAMKDAKGTYKMPWHSPVVANDLPTNTATNHVYRGVNALSLWIDGIAKGFSTGFWATYKQWQSLGVQVRYRERGSLIVFYRQFELSEEESAAGTRARSMARASWVFNAAQVENWTPPEPAPRSIVEIDGKVEAFVRAVGADIPRIGDLLHPHLIDVSESLDVYAKELIRIGDRLDRIVAWLDRAETRCPSNSSTRVENSLSTKLTESAISSSPSVVTTKEQDAPGRPSPW